MRRAGLGHASEQYGVLSLGDHVELETFAKILRGSDEFLQRVSHHLSKVRAVLCRHSCNALIYCKKIPDDSRPYDSGAQPFHGVSVRLLLRPHLPNLGRRERFRRCCIRQRRAGRDSRQRSRRNHLARGSAPVAMRCHQLFVNLYQAVWSFRHRSPRRAISDGGTTCSHSPPAPSTPASSCSAH